MLWINTVLQLAVNNYGVALIFTDHADMCMQLHVTRLLLFSFVCSRKVGIRSDTFALSHFKLLSICLCYPLLINCLPFLFRFDGYYQVFSSKAVRKQLGTAHFPLHSCTNFSNWPHNYRQGANVYQGILYNYVTGFDKSWLPYTQHQDTLHHQMIAVHIN